MGCTLQVGEEKQKKGRFGRMMSVMHHAGEDLAAAAGNTVR